MNKILFQEVKDRIKKGLIPNQHELFAGAGLIISNDPNRSKGEFDLFIVEPDHAAALSWLIFQLGKIYQKEINYLNKEDFYQYLGCVINACQQDKSRDLFEMLEQLLDSSEAFDFD